MHILEPTALSDEVAFEVAMNILDSHLVNTTVDKQNLVLQLLEHSSLFEFVVSGTFN